MKKFATLFFLFSIFCCPYLFAEEPAINVLTLKQTYELALKRSEDIAISHESIEEAQAHFYQALSQVLPKVNFVIQNFWQDVPKNGVTSSGSSSLRRSTPLAGFTFSQPLFQGFREFAAMQGAGAEKSQRVYEKKRAEELLFIDVSESYYALAQARRDIEILDETHKLTEDRVGELKERIRVGRSRDSEMQNTISDLKMLEADRITARRVEKVTRELLEFYIGRPINEDLSNEDLESKEAGALENYLIKSIDRSDVRAAKEAFNLADKRVWIAQAGFWPTANLSGDYYTHRISTYSGVDWDVTLSVDVPIFEGTQVFGDVKEAAAEKEKAKLALSKAQRSAELDVKQSYDTYVSSHQIESAFSDAAAASKENYRLQSEDYRSNLVSNLDVLDALKKYEDVSRELNQAHFEAKKDYWRLKVAAGEELV